PETLLWVIAESKQLKQAHRLLSDTYSELQDDLKQDTERMRTSHLVDMIELHPTAVCNMRCAYCYIPEAYRKRPLVMSRDDVDRVVRKVLSWVEEKGGMKRIIFHGGEPLLARDSIFPVIDRYWRDVEFGIQTNATLLTQGDADFIKERNVHVSLSLDGHTAEVNDRCRQYSNGGSTFDDVVRNISLFRDFEWNGVIVTITRHNVGYLAEMLRFLYGMGIRSALFNPVSPANPAAALLMPKTEDLLAGYRGLINELVRLNTVPGARRFVVDNIESLVVALVTSNMRVLYCHMTPCGAGRFMYVIDPAGYVYPCSEFVGHEEFRCGNIFSDPMAEVLDAPPCKRLRARYVERVKGCISCEYRMICGANCPAAVQSLSGNLDGRSPYCEFLKGSVNLIFRTFLDHGIESAFCLVSTRFEEMLRKSALLLDASQGGARQPRA
ncbi:MAG: radical SAM protein, partial [Candidatus Bipolaricaulis anaerobius]|nr:radical SAM protein [Candidatus Bipolaricaulis anaerobius]MDD5764281.1 radical SAM protein [Candidatus Bipolaricaulis anaerobius]